jgi:uncharacterized protein YcbX
MPTVARINVTPVKSTALHHPSDVRLERSGPAGDREFFFVDGFGRRFGGDAKTPLMSITATFDADRDHLELRLPNGTTVAGPADGGGDAISVNYEGRRVAAHLVEGEWSDVLSNYVGRLMRLARLDEPGTLVDEPVTLVSIASVEELGRRGGRASLDPRRFRMTFELDGCSAHEEDGWSGRRVGVGEAELDIGGPVPRCVITTLDPDTGAQDFSTLRVIAGYRELTPDGEVPFGLYAKVTRPGTVRVGDRVDTPD